MKKSLTLAALFAAVAMASYGGTILLAQAQTATPSDTAALQQQLDDAKAQLIQLEMQAGEVPTGDAGTPATAPTMTVAPATTLSPADLSEMNAALTALATLLTTLQAKAAQDPQFITSNGPVLASALGGIGQTVASIGSELSSNNGSAIAMTAPTPAPQAAMPSAPTAMTQPTTVMPSAPSAAAVTPSAQTAPVAPPSAPVAPAPQTAQATSAFSFSQLNWPLIIVIILIVAAIAIWLWWDDGDEKKQPVVKTITPAPQKPMQQPQPSQSMNQAPAVPMNSMSSGSQGQTVNRPQPTSAPTPLSSAVTPHANR